MCSINFVPVCSFEDLLQSFKNNNFLSAYNFDTENEKQIQFNQHYYNF